jgi:hypothetical protein
MTPEEMGAKAKCATNAPHRGQHRQLPHLLVRPQYFRGHHPPRAGGGKTAVDCGFARPAAPSVTRPAARERHATVPQQPCVIW